MEVPQNLKNRTILQPSNYTTRYLPKGYKNADLKGYMHPNVYSSTIDNSRGMERAQLSIDECVDKDVVYTYNGILLSNQKKKSCHLQQCGWN